MRVLFIFFGCILVVVGAVFYWALKHDYLLLSNTNSIVVTANPPLDVNKVVIEFGISANSINRTSDYALFEHRGNYSLLFAGREIQQMENEYGENDLMITYDNKYYLTFRQFKTNWRHQHEYKFHFYSKDNKIYIHADIVGVDNMSFDQPMKEIRSVKQL